MKLFTKKIIKKPVEESKIKFMFEELIPEDELTSEQVDISSDVGEDAADDRPSVDTSDGDVEREDNNDKEEIDISAIIEEIRREYESKISSAYERGFKDAERSLREQIYSELRKEIDEHLQLFDNLIKNFYHEVDSFNRKVEKMIVTLAVEISRKVLRKEIDENDEFILGQVREALRRVLGVSKVRLRINPDDERVIREHKPELLQMADSIRELVIETDPSIERGGCILESELGNVDARISTQFGLIETKLIENPD